VCDEGEVTAADRGQASGDAQVCAPLPASQATQPVPLQPRPRQRRRTSTAAQRKAEKAPGSTVR
jgi:hypothetical protein